MQNTFRLLFMGLIVSLFIMRPVSSYADSHDHDGDNHKHNSAGHDSGHGHDSGGGHDRGHHDRSYVNIGFSILPDNYYYNAPYYPPVDDVLVSPPLYEPVVVNGNTYYINNGSYYVYNGYGYEAVEPPVTVTQPPIVVQPTTVVNQEQSADSFTVNIPNKKGGYTAVTLKKSGNGYTGPQGEFYT